MSTLLVRLIGSTQNVVCLTLKEVAKLIVSDLFETVNTIRDYAVRQARGSSDGGDPMHRKSLQLIHANSREF
jgi:hypothetical protein